MAGGPGSGGSGHDIARKSYIVAIVSAVLAAAAILVAVYEDEIRCFVGAASCTKGRIDPTAEPPAGWRLVSANAFDHPDGPIGLGDEWRCPNGSMSHGSGSFSSSRLVLQIRSNCDYTYQVGYSSKEASTGAELYLGADVEFVSGPSDGYCALLFGYVDSEHWYAFKISRDAFEVTQNDGMGSNHIRLDDRRPSAVIIDGAPNRMAVLSSGSEVSFYINRRLVAKHSISNLAGITRVGAQAANFRDVVRCAFDNVELLVP
ncbi:hypothetical protein [Micromonospora chersina]|uniref:hypothetical protein n=1 Tax=Micromonospora chersina TaxID=47854 RepID=UPI003711A5E8